jgi:hypothetical protein
VGNLKMAKFRIARNVTKREYFEFEAANETAAAAAVHQLNVHIRHGDDYDVETELDECVFVEEKDVPGDSVFILTNWTE